MRQLCQQQIDLLTSSPAAFCRASTTQLVYRLTRRGKSRLLLPLLKAQEVLMRLSKVSQQLLLAQVFDPLLTRFLRIMIKQPPVSGGIRIYPNRQCTFHQDSYSTGSVYSVCGLSRALSNKTRPSQAAPV